MKLVFYSLVLNHHQACVADAFYHILGDDYTFVETAECHDNKGANEDFSSRSYLLRAWDSPQAWSKAMALAQTADVCVFSGYEALPFEKERMKLGLLSFDMGERMLKKGWINLASPRIFKMFYAYHNGGWNRKPLYKLCCSSFAKQDQYKLNSFKNKCYKWGYFVGVPSKLREDSLKIKENAPVRFMWCARFLKLKHPELVLSMAQHLRCQGHNFHIDIYGDEGHAAASEEVFSRRELELLVNKYALDQVVNFHGNKPNNEILKAMEEHDVFLFTSDNREGWGVVVNESMSNGCTVICSNAVGSTDYLVKNGITGYKFKSGDVASLTEKASWLIEHPMELQQMKSNAYNQMKDLWSPQHAAVNFLQLISDLQNGQETSIEEGPCSKA